MYVTVSMIVCWYVCMLVKVCTYIVYIFVLPNDTLLKYILSLLWLPLLLPNGYRCLLYNVLCLWYSLIVGADILNMGRTYFTAFSSIYVRLSLNRHNSDFHRYSGLFRSIPFAYYYPPGHFNVQNPLNTLQVVFSYFNTMN